MFITNAGQTLRCRVDTISTMGRAVQGVRLMDLAPGEKVVSIARLAERDDETGGEDARGDDDADAGDSGGDSSEPGGDASEG
jgi:DNA gyrase subunit A